MTCHRMLQPAAPAFALAFVLVGVATASATSGWGCYRVNLGPDDRLNVRADASARSTVVARVHADDQPIIGLVGLPRGEGVQADLFTVHQTEIRACVPASLPLGARWCPVTLVDAKGITNGWLKRRFVDHSECP